MSEHATRPFLAAALADGVAKLKNAAIKARVHAVPAQVIDYCMAVAASPEMVEALGDPWVCQVAREPLVLRHHALMLRLGARPGPAHAVEALHALLSSRELAAALADPAVCALLRDPRTLPELAQLLRVLAHPDSPAAN